MDVYGTDKFNIFIHHRGNEVPDIQHKMNRVLYEQAVQLKQNNEMDVVALGMMVDRMLDKPIRQPVIRSVVLSSIMEHIDIKALKQLHSAGFIVNEWNHGIYFITDSNPISMIGAMRSLRIKEGELSATPATHRYPR